MSFPYIGILASHDHYETNKKIVDLLDKLIRETKYKDQLYDYRFLMTGGTYRRVISATECPQEFIDLATNCKVKLEKVNDTTRKFMEERLTVLPSRSEGGITILANCITQQKCSILWPFLTPLTAHWLTPENLALLRLCDQWHVKRLMNTGSVLEWVVDEAKYDVSRNPQPESFQLEPLTTELEGRIPLPKFLRLPQKKKSKTDEVNLADMTIAMIAHDEMKARMVEFAVDNESTLVQFKQIYATGTTGKDIGEAVPLLEEGRKIKRFHSGPKGGDIEIATQILAGRCDVVIFFVDPLHPHPHIEDIRVVFGACMINDDVRMLTNELQARAWIEHVARRQAETERSPLSSAARSGVMPRPSRSIARKR